MTDVEMKSVKIPRPLYKRIKERITETEFTSVSEYVGYVLSEVLDNLDDMTSKHEGITEEEDEKVKERLRALGYLD